MRVFLLVILCLSVMACGQRREIPPAETRPDQIDTDGRPLLPLVTSGRLDETRGGVILSATGVVPTRGYWAGALIPENRGRPVDGVITYQLRVAPPRPDLAQPGQTEIVAATVVRNRDLVGVRQIVVRAREGAISLRP